MSEIRAFVAHSYDDRDALIVTTFLKFFSEVQRGQPSFSWDHAQSAEARGVASKVLAALEEKNALIAICTRAEVVFSSRNRWLSRIFGETQWKTSDWILQEIGLALGRGLTPILLVEKGLRSPGHLQGDLEYIEFDRSRPEASFRAFLEMINKLSPRSPPALLQSSGPAISEETPTTESPFYRKPDSTWTKRDYESAYFLVMAVGERANADEIKQSYLESGYAKAVIDRDTWLAMCELTSIRLGLGGSLLVLQALADAQPTSSDIHESLAAALQYFRSFAKAAQTFLAAAALEGDFKRTVHLKGQAAIALFRAGALSDSAAQIAEIRRSVITRDEGELQLLKTLRELADLQKTDLAAIAAMERIIELRPDDADTRFQLAYRHANVGNTEVALHHYLAIPDSNKTSATWNNIGVAYSTLSMPEKAVAAYRHAEELGNALAMSNLARKLLAAGFAPEAEALCKTALAAPDCPEHIGETFSTLKGLPAEETKRLESLLEKATSKVSFFATLGRAISRPEPSVLASHWKSPVCDLSVTLNGSEFRATGSYTAQGGLAFSLTQREITYNVTYNGNLRGHTIDGHVKYARQNPHGAGAATSLLGAWDSSDKRFVMSLSDDDAELLTVEISETVSSEPYKIIRSTS